MYVMYVCVNVCILYMHLYTHMPSFSLLFHHHFSPGYFQANVMLEYDIDEADKLLTRNIETAKGNLREVEKDINFLRDQITTTEVSILSQ